MKEFFSGKTILITGAAGTVGKELSNQLYSLAPAELRLMDNNESELFFLQEKFGNGNVYCHLGDIRDKDKILKLAAGVDVIIHCAALKHVIISEHNPFDAVQTNIIGVENLIQAAIACKVKYFLFTSTDKAVNPTNVMGTSKLFGEKLVTAANIRKNNGHSIFFSSRFGNVLGSRGSVVPIFMGQISKGGPVTLTDSRMTRFIMSVKDASNLVLKSVTIAQGGEVFVSKMPVVRIRDLAEVMIDLLAPRYGYSPYEIKILEIGSKPGEKMYEELLSGEETTRTIELGDMFVVTPALKKIHKDINYKYDDTVSDNLLRSYISAYEEVMTKEEIKSYLIDNKVFEYVEAGVYGGAM